ncbi:hypothetical protein A2276_06950 [candidate division WOR-1 bacterium RIFOXYA12_FULL_43_27]|uniref:DNA mismatch repair protein MutL n=1 Tax=candidate division WOR-1 bacterium RIFOXYC2_FULL_46_14 TaxID=1802587 RepID=A0A1F4U869_UNCSA|nr:MAG: hypothetical protein A2276_06950 [candidate division WOR-1 bacterium RIFOXYA12_FULL_43_27]OGC20937.1 MAG: hypothetical protein A2292_04950 [candidate division WOR-1 bacterium RIFOXYB2_FULL_46_45]OGC32303.1 MAG: hypothetical protein A2232_06500 [candidate division WOR-1 bacterium RIFOXYA2_FULL_46_56]OGC40493.1 MAG: hypothetical protein A2438_02970 [candidate division WOR-1 bacterium RIFOXYC2_FULL_46_14]
MLIKILPPDLVNKIAAGEVIERPSSVVKELVENAIDAKATQITIEIEDAGKKLIRVSDNGSGMNREELKLSVERHATSKISNLDDLFNIQTLGFRGEALPSICSVGKTELESGGTKILVEGGKIKKEETTGGPEGTSISVKNLFYNVPVRLKFLKSNFTELSQISSLIEKFILSNPGVKFKYVADDKVVYISSGNGKLLDAIAVVYGAEIAKQLIEIKDAGVGGYISKPNLSRVDRNYESLFVNGRYVRNGLVLSSFEAAYRTLIPNGRYPVAVIFIEVDPTEVDVNVHPSKREVKFLKTKDVLDAVYRAAKQALLSIAVVTENVSSAPSFTNWEPLDQVQIGEVEIAVTAIQPLTAIYQFQKTYIIATDGIDLVLIDQHAAHERILYDCLTLRQSSGQAAQNLLVPEALEFTHEESLLLEENLDSLKELGFDLEGFGKNSFILRAVPAILTNVVIKDTLSELVKNSREERFKIMACKGAVKAGDALNVAEINRLIRDLYQTANPLTCPHGRPTMIKITQNDFEKMFGR